MTAARRPARRAAALRSSTSARNGIDIGGALAEHFKSGVQALVAGQQSGDAHGLQDRIDAFIAGDTALAQQPVLID